MKKVKKESRVEHEVVVVTEWRGVDKRFLFVKRPEKGEFFLLLYLSFDAV